MPCFLKIQFVISAAEFTDEAAFVEHTILGRKVRHRVVSPMDIAGRGAKRQEVKKQKQPIGRRKPTNLVLQYLTLTSLFEEHTLAREDDREAQ